MHKSIAAISLLLILPTQSSVLFVDSHSINSFCAGGAFACLVTDANESKCWGQRRSFGSSVISSDNQGDALLELGNYMPSINFGASVTVNDIRCGNQHVCVKINDSSMKCLGANAYAQVGLGLSSSVTYVGSETGYTGDALPFVNVGTGIDVLDIALGREHTCAKVSGNQVKCFGYNYYGQLGLGDKTTRGGSAASMGDGLPYINLGSGVEISSIHSGVYASSNCVILSSPIENADRIKCWGRNDYYQLGYGTVYSASHRGDESGEMGDSLPLVDLGTESRVKQIKMGYQHTCSVLFNDLLKCWGRSNYGQTASGSSGVVSSTGDSLSFVSIDSGKTIKYLSTGSDHNCIVYDDETSMKCYGYNAKGQLGQGDKFSRGSTTTTTISNIPNIQLGVSNDDLVISSIYSGYAFNCVLFSDGVSVKCFGENANGQLAIGSTSNQGDDTNEIGLNLPFADLFDISIFESFASRSLEDETTINPTQSPSLKPTKSPSMPTFVPTKSPSKSPTTKPTTKTPTTRSPTPKPTTRSPTTKSPTKAPSANPTLSPTNPTMPSESPTLKPTNAPTYPTFAPTKSPTRTPTTKSPTSKSPTKAPSTKSPTIPTQSPTLKPTNAPTLPRKTENYIIHGDKGSLNWAASEAACLNMYGTHLATITSLAQQTEILNSVGQVDFWIGLNDLAVKNVFVWSSGSTSTYRNWEEDDRRRLFEMKVRRQLDDDEDEDEDERCVRLKGEDRAWSTKECSKTYSILVCDKPQTATPTNHPSTTLPSLSPTTSQPSQSPSTAMPSLSPVEPTKAPTTPTNPGDTESPSTVPTTRVPTRTPSTVSPTTFSPTIKPTTKIPTTSTPSPTTKAPTPTTTTSRPSLQPTLSPSEDISTSAPTSVSTNTTATNPPSTSSSNQSLLNQASLSIGLGVSLPIIAIASAAAGFFLFARQRAKRQDAAQQNQPLMSAQTSLMAAGSNDVELVEKKMKVTNE